MAFLVCVQVWASKWNDRAWLSRKARGVADADLFMACLLQQVCQVTVAALLLHTRPLLLRRWCNCWHAQNLTVP